MTAGQAIEAGALLFSIGINGLAIWFFKNYQAMDQDNLELYGTNLGQGFRIEELEAELAVLRKKTTPWNKGLKGYKHKPRTSHPPLRATDAEFFAAHADILNPARYTLPQTLTGTEVI
jgi:hypothetical protein